MSDQTPSPVTAASSCAPPSTDPGRWFAEEVQPHEPVLRAYLRRKFPKLSDVDDVIQECYLRLLRAKATGTLRSVQGFLFTTARNAAFDVFRRKPTTSLETMAELEGDSVLEDNGTGVADMVSRGQDLALLAEAIEALPRRCRRILKLRKIYGLSHKEIARRLDISERTVNVQVGKGVQRCAQYLQARGAIGRKP